MKLTALLPAAALLLLASPTPSAEAAPSAKKTTKTQKTRGPKARKAKAPRAPITKAKKITLGKAHVSPPKNPTPGSIKGNGGGGGGLPPGPGSVQTNDDGELSFVLSANQPFVKFAGMLSAHYPRDWEPSVHDHGEVWISNHRLPGETYVTASIFVQPGYEYRVDVCVSANSNEDLVAKVGNTTTNFDAGHSDDDCNLPLILESGETGWTDIEVRIAHNEPGAFALDRFEVRRTKK